MNVLLSSTLDCLCFCRDEQVLLFQLYEWRTFKSRNPSSFSNVSVCWSLIVNVIFSGMTFLSFYKLINNGNNQYSCSCNPDMKELRSLSAMRHDGQSDSDFYLLFKKWSWIIHDRIHNHPQIMTLYANYFFWSFYIYQRHRIVLNRFLYFMSQWQKWY